MTNYPERDGPIELADDLEAKLRAEIEFLQGYRTEVMAQVQGVNAINASLEAEIERLRAALLKTQILLADHMPPEATFGNVEDMLRWLDDEQSLYKPEDGK